MHRPDHPDATTHLTPTRRRVLRLGCAACGAALLGGAAGCLGDDEPAEPPAAVAIDPGDTCDSCGMNIADNPGPNAQAFYAEGEPNGHPSPALFDAIRGGLLPFHREHVRRGWEATAIYVTDYSRVDYERFEREGATYLSSHVAADSFAPAREMFYVVDTGIRGAMGPDHVPFGERTDADAVAAEFGGSVVEYDGL